MFEKNAMEEWFKVEDPNRMRGDEEVCREIEALRKKVEDKERKAKETYDRLLRTAADFDNYKKRVAREKEEWVKSATEELIKAVLPFLDNLDRTLEHSEGCVDARSVWEGVRLTRDQLLRTLKGFGLSPIESLGLPFDPAVHEAMAIAETDRVEANRVVEEFVKGYLLNGRLIRAAKVSVSKPPKGASRHSAHRRQRTL